MTPINDPRPFAEVLRDWMDRHRMSAYAVAKRLGISRGITVTGWLSGKPVTYEPALRLAMAAVDAGLDVQGD